MKKTLADTLAKELMAWTRQQHPRSLSVMFHRDRDILEVAVAKKHGGMLKRRTMCITLELLLFNKTRWRSIVAYTIWSARREIKEGDGE